MLTIVYGICLVISVMICIYIIGISEESIDPYYLEVIIIMPIAILGYWISSQVTSPESAMIGYCIIYLDSTILLMIILFSMFRMVGIKVRPMFKVLIFGAAFAHLFLVWMNIHSGLYYKEIVIRKTSFGTAINTTAGPLKLFHSVYMAAVVIIMVVVIVMAFIRKGTYSRRLLNIYAIGMMCAIGIYLAESAYKLPFSLLPILYTVVELVLFFDYKRVYMHNVSTIISLQQKYHGNRGYAVFDKKRRFLSCSEKIYEYIPDLAGQNVDEQLLEDSEPSLFLYGMIDAYERNGDRSSKFKHEGMTCVCEINTFSLGHNGEMTGYIFDVRDATEEQRVLDIMSSYNESLNRMVKKKTDNIRAIQGKIVSGMANMIENRDNNTGGHVKRTSDIIRIFADEIIRQHILSLSAQFAEDIVRAAPMHDLGKITIEDSILNKPGKLTDEEYEIMKTHAEKSGETVMTLLEGVEERHFVKTAFNVARYHHERWDGRGYPEHLVGTMIPVEARIMAVVDVYDALVSKRSYKEGMSFDEVADIMISGMGTQFDPNLKRAFTGCRSKLEDYYKALR